MKIILFGATGPTGKLILENLIKENHQVTCFVRNPGKIHIKSDLITVITGSILDAKAIEMALRGQELVISALGSKPTLKDKTMSQAATLIVQAMEKQNVKRIIVISTLGIKETYGMMGLLFTYALQTIVLRNNFSEKVKIENMLEKSNLEWIAVRPSVLTNGAKTGSYKEGFDKHETITPKISRSDVADFILKNISFEKYNKTTVNLSY